MTVLFIIGILACLFVLMMGKGDQSYLSEHKWLIVVPVFFILLLGYSCIDLENTTVPSGSFMTKPVEVKDEYSKDIYYWNLQVDIDDESWYQIIGYVSPKTGKLVNVESRESGRFGDTVYFSEDFNISEYRASVSKKDIDVSYTERLTALGWFDLLSYIAMFVVAIIDLVVMIRVFQKKKSDDMYREY